MEENNVTEIIEVLKETQKQNSTQETRKVEIDNSAEKSLKTLATIILICGIIATIICMFTLIVVEVPHGYGNSTYMVKDFSPSGFVTTILVLLSTLISWGFMKIIANISLTLKEINKKIK